MARKNKASAVSYVRGLLDGMHFDKDTDNGKLMAAVVEALEDLSEQIVALRNKQNDFDAAMDKTTDDIDLIGNAVGDMLSMLSDEFDDDDDDFDDDEFDDDDFDDDDEDDDDDEEDDEGDKILNLYDESDDEDSDSDPDVYVGVICPECRRRMYVLEEELSEGTKHACPYCGAKFKAVPEYESDAEILTAKPVKDD